MTAPRHHFPGRAAAGVAAYSFGALFRAGTWRALSVVHPCRRYRSATTRVLPPLLGPPAGRRLTVGEGPGGRLGRRPAPGPAAVAPGPVGGRRLPGRARIRRIRPRRGLRQTTRVRVTRECPERVPDR